MQGSGKYLQMTEETAAALEKYGPAFSKRTGMILGTVRNHGKIVQELQFTATMWNPASAMALSSMMQQMALQNTLNRMQEQLSQIQTSINEILRNDQDRELSNLVGIADTLDDAMIVLNTTGAVTTATWSKVQGTAHPINAAQELALRRTNNVVQDLGRPTKVAEGRKAVEEAKESIQQLLSLLAYILRLHAQYASLELEFVKSTDPDNWEKHRAGLLAASDHRLERIGGTLDQLGQQFHHLAKLASKGKVTHPRAANALNAGVRTAAEFATQFAARAGISRDLTPNLDQRTWRKAVDDHVHHQIEQGRDTVRGLQNRADRFIAERGERARQRLENRGDNVDELETTSSDDVIAAPDNDSDEES